MTHSLKLAALLLGLATINHQLSTCRAQGSLTPPAGAPAPVMKSLDQIEARTAITNRTSTFTITQPGSYYLTGNLTVTSGNGLVIATNGVTLDLNGFTIANTVSGNAFTAGVYISAEKNVRVKNGFIQGGVTNNGSDVYLGGGFGNGIYGNINSFNIFVTDISVNGCSEGISLGAGAPERHCLVDSCQVRTVAFDGILASIVTRCAVSDAGQRAIVCDRASDSFGESTSTFSFYNGLNANDTAINCKGVAAGGTGLYAISAINCYGSSTTGIGLSAKTANNCYGSRSGGTAINATVANGCYAQFGTNIITYKYNMP